MPYWIWSGKRGLNPQPPAWKAGALPIELLPHLRGRGFAPRMEFYRGRGTRNEDLGFSLPDRLIGGGVLSALPTFSKSLHHAPVPTPAYSVYLFRHRAFRFSRSRSRSGSEAALSLWAVRRYSPSCRSCYRSVFRPAGYGGERPRYVRPSVRAVKRLSALPTTQEGERLHITPAGAACWSCTNDAGVSPACSGCRMRAAFAALGATQ